MRSENNLGLVVRRSFGALALLALSAGPMAAHAEGWYAGVGVGQADWDLIGEEDTSMKLFGGYGFNPNIAVEFGYLDLGEAEISGGGASASATADGFTLAGVGMFPVSSNVNILAKIGLFNWDAEAEVNLFGTVMRADDSGTDVFYGFGAQFDVNKSVAIRAEYEIYDIDGEDVDNIGLSAVFRF
jgi:OOP family OmpA-OmpF porin